MAVRYRGRARTKIKTLHAQPPHSPPHPQDDAAPAPPAAAPERASPGGGYGSSYKGGLRGTPSIIKRKLESYQKDLAAGKKPTKSAEKAKVRGGSARWVRASARRKQGRVPARPRATARAHARHARPPAHPPPPQSTKVAKPAAAKPMSLAGAVLAALVAFALIGGLVFQVCGRAGAAAPREPARRRGARAHANRALRVSFQCSHPFTPAAPRRYNEAGRSRVSAPTPVPRARGRK
jgi:hypothetical protein